MELDFGAVVLTAVLATVGLALFWSLKLAKGPSKNGNDKGGRRETASRKQQQQQPGQQKKKTAAAAVSSGASTREAKARFTHSWLLATLKGHTGVVLDMDFSPDGRHLATCSEDRVLMLWLLRLDKLAGEVRELNMKDIRTVRAAVQFDHATLVRWSPDSKALLTVRRLGNDVEIYRLTKKADQPAGAPPTVAVAGALPKHREADLIALGVASTGRFIMTCTPKNELDLMDLKGQLITSHITNQMETYYARVSPCAKLIAVAGFTPDVKVLEVTYTKSGDFDKVGRAFELTGHSSGVWSLDFSPDSSRIVTVSKDGTWRLYNTNIDYAKGQLATLVSSGKWPARAGTSAFVALAPDGLIVAVGAATSLFLYSAATGELLAQIDDIHTEPIKAVRIDSTSRFVLTTGDRVVRVWHNVPGFRAAVADLEAKLRRAGNATLRQRIQQQLDDAQRQLDRFQ